MEKQGFKQLIAWQKSHELTLAVYRVTATFPTDERFGLVSQMRRAAIAIPANIAEGYNRQHRKEYLQFLAVSNGSLAELETYLLLARDLGYLAPDQFALLDDLQREVGKMLAGLLRSLRPGPGP